MPISFINLVVFLSFRIDGKKHDNADGPSGPYAAAGSVAATMGTLPTKLMGNRLVVILAGAVCNIYILIW
jgi:hypothetical protein